MYTIHCVGSKPVKKHGKWELERIEWDEEYPDEKVRDCDMCTSCGFTAYPECKEWCNSWRPGSRAPQ